MEEINIIYSIFSTIALKWRKSGLSATDGSFECSDGAQSPGPQAKRPRMASGRIMRVPALRIMKTILFINMALLTPIRALWTNYFFFGDTGDGCDTVASTISVDPKGLQDQFLIGGLTKSERLMSGISAHVACHAEPVPFIALIKDAAVEGARYFNNILKLNGELGRFSRVTAAKWGDRPALTSNYIEGLLCVALEFSKYDDTVVHAGTTIMFFDLNLVL